MTQIKLRRDTSANFTSKNPVLGVGEPAYETDTKKLKIGDGTTAYTQLEYFSAGGSSTDITATLPLKIVDGVISLEVDGQTIQIVDGKLHANLDELNNTVNDLSGKVTAVEGEVAKKEDEITALEPITLEKRVINNLNGMLYTPDGTTLYAQSITQLALEDDWVGPSITYNNPVSYIDIPLDINKDQVITIPRFRTSYSYSEATTFMLGSYDANGLFYPIFFQAKGDSNNGWCWLISNNYPEAVGTTHLNGSNTGGSSFGDLNGSSDKVYIQAKYDESSGFHIRTFGAYPDDSYSKGLQIVYTNPADIERLRQITACRFINMGKMNEASTAISVTLFGRYDGAHLERGTLPDLTNIPNSFSLTDVQSLNYIQLNVGSGLSVVDGKLTATGGITTLATGYQDLPLPTREVWYKSVGDGYIAARFASTSANQFCQLGINSDGTGIPDSNSDYDGTQFSQGPNNKSTITLPISKNHYYSCNWNYGGGIIQLRFMPSINK